MKDYHEAGKYGWFIMPKEIFQQMMAHEWDKLIEESLKEEFGRIQKALHVGIRPWSTWDIPAVRCKRLKGE